MDIREPNQKLLAAGCNPATYAIGEKGTHSDAHLLHYANGYWQVSYTERGHIDPPTFTSPDQATACAYFYNFITGLQQTHCIGFFRTEAAAIALKKQLSKHQLMTRMDRIPYGGEHDPRFRVFVTGKDIFVARRLLGETLPLRD